MRILLINDDGYFAKGILALAKVLEVDHEVAIVAPIREESCASHRITIDRPLSVTKMSVTGIDCPIYAIDGTPVDCVKMALHVPLFPNPDIVISGINSGYNLGYDHIYSGTVGIAIEANINGIPALAVSYGSKSSNGYEKPATIIQRLLPEIMAYEGERVFLYSINFPAVENGEYKGIKKVALGDIHYYDTVVKRVDPRGNDYYWLALDPNGKCNGENGRILTDIEAVDANYVSIAPILFDFTDYDKLMTLPDFSCDLKD